MIHYFVKSVDEKSEIKMEIMETSGTVISTYNSKAKAREQLPVKTGGNRFVWDMRYPGYTTFPGMVYYGSPNQGPKGCARQIQSKVND
ncbi:MAG: hypothetical protein U5K54_11070 [Cytophagales bacterium]|nr:hypothetical protein [Cytophagales bacterium]